MQAIGRFVPVRFLALIAHFVVLVTLFWSFESNLQSCLQAQYTQDQYDTEHQNLTIGLSLGIALFAFELISFLVGISMFKSTIAMISILAHVVAAVTLSLFILEHWECTDYWYIFGFCSALPAFFESIAVVFFVMGKRK